MKLIGIVGRMYYNKDNQEIVQLNDYLRRTLSRYEDIVSIMILPTNDISYVGIGMGNDKIDNIAKKKLDYLLGICDGFIIPGGTYWYKIDEYIIKYAIDCNKPILGICAGFQAMCSMFSKNRNKFDMTKKLGNDNHYGEFNSYVHDVIIKENTLLSKILKHNRIKVNSLHHDYIDIPLDKLIVSAVSEDNIIEAIELSDHKFFLGIQWHPEYLMDDSSKIIFDKFIDNIS